jgi:diadenosine tetraphosphate (Ap4A) HIT family hydrolase
MQISQATCNKLRISELTIKDYDNWILLTLPVQFTLGSMVLMNKNGAADFGKLTSPELVEMGSIISKIESKLKAAFNWDKMNYYMLRMKDPEVHFDVIPRYASDREFGGQIFRDQAFSSPPPSSIFSNENPTTDGQLLQIHNHLKSLFADDK